MKADWRYEVVDQVLLRLAAQPAGLSAVTEIDLDPGDPSRTDETVAYIGRLWADPLLREAVHVSSGSLARDVDRIAGGHRPDNRALCRVALALTRYTLRAATRPTPFGLMAGVAAAEFGDAKARFGDRHQRAVSIDLGWLLPLVRALERRPEILRHLDLVVNNLCHVRGDRITLAYIALDGEEDVEPAEISVRRTPVVARVLDLAGRPISGTDLVAGIAATFPGAPAGRIDRFVAELVEQEILLTSLRPPPRSADPLGHVLALLPDGVEVAERAALERIRAHTGAYAATPVGAGLAEWRALTGELTRLRAADRPVHVDLRVDADVRLPRIVAEEAARAVDTLARLARPEAVADHLVRYHEDFVERYGTDGLVPLAELLDADLGLGPPATYARPFGTRRTEPRSPSTDRDRFLLALAAGALRDGDTEIVVDDRIEERLARTDGAPAQPCVELFAHLLAASVPAIEAGEFRLVLAEMSGFRGHAGMTWGRFLPMLPAAGAPLAALTVAGAAPARAAEIVTHASTGRLANVVRTPPLLPLRIPVGVFDDPGDPAVLALDDLLVGADDRSLFLVSRRLGGVLPVAFHMLSEYVVGCNEARFLRELPHGWRRGWTRWRWGAAEQLPRLPRIRVGRTVVAPATWRLDDTLFDSALSFDDWRRAFDSWRERWSVPARVQAVFLDHRIDLDLDATLHRHLLRDQLRRSPAMLLHESPTTVDGLGWSDGHCAELVITAVNRAPARRPDPVEVATRSRPARRIRHQPGGEWVYAKLYASRPRHDDLVTTHLPRLVTAARADRWFFLRYTDPQPHIRIRLHGDSPALLPVLHGWADELCRTGLAARLVLDCYEPELDRYGGPDAMAAAEAVFEADSEAVLRALASQAAGGLAMPPALLAAAGCVDLATRLVGDGWADWLLTEYPKGAHQAEFRRIRREALRMIDPHGDWAALRAEPGGPELLDAWQRRGEALRAYADRLTAAGIRPETVCPSLLHMHHNRLVGIDPAGELAAYAIARGSVQAHLDRRRFGQ